MADRRRVRLRWRLGFGFSGSTAQEREGIRGREGEEHGAHLIQARGGSGGTELRARGGRATRAVATAPEVEDDQGFPENPLEFSFLFPSRPFLFYCSVFYLKPAVNHLIEAPKHFQIL